MAAEISIIVAVEMIGGSFGSSSSYQISTRLVHSSVDGFGVNLLTSFVFNFWKAICPYVGSLLELIFDYFTCFCIPILNMFVDRFSSNNLLNLRSLNPQNAFL